MDDFKIRGVKRRLVKPRTALTVALVVAVAVVAWLQRGNIASVAATVSKGAAIPLAVALVCESLRVVFHANAFTRSFRVVGFRVPLRATIPAWFKMIFMNTVLPSGGTSGMAAVVDTARQRGMAVGSATSATLFSQTCYYLAMLTVISIGFGVMGYSGTLQVRDVLLGGVMGAVALAFVGLLAMGHYAPGLLQRFMRWVERLVVRLLARLHIKKVPKPWADNLVHSFSSAATELSRNPRRALSVLASMIVAMAFDMCAFIAAGFAFDVTSVAALLGGYVTALVFNSFTVTPGGVGVVEGLASAVLAGYGYPASLAVSVVLVYRMLMYWIPFVIGGVVTYVTGAFGLGGVGGKAGRADATGGAGSADGVGAAGAAGGAEGQKGGGETGETYVRRRRSGDSLRARAVAFVHDQLEFRTVLCAAVAVVTAVAGFVFAALPADPVMVEAVTNHVLGHGPLDPIAMVVFSYVLLACVPGIIIHDQGNWLMSMAALILLGIATAMAGRSVWMMLLVLAALALFAVAHRCFGARGYFTSLARLTRVLLYCVLVAVAYALVGSLLYARGHVSPDPGVWGSLWLGLQSVALDPHMPAGTVFDGGALWFFASVGAIRATLTVLLVYVIVGIVVRRAVERNRPEQRAARARAKAEAEKAAEQRKAERRRRWAERRGEAQAGDAFRRAPDDAGDEACPEAEVCPGPEAETGSEVEADEGACADACADAAADDGMPDNRQSVEKD